MKTNIILQGDALIKLKELPNKSINMLMTSPPYWALRDYSKEVEIVWGGVMGCKHKFEIKERKLHGGSAKNTVHGAILGGGLEVDWKTKDGFCKKCGAWKGQLGLEPTFDLYIKHLCDIFDEVKRVLRDDGTCWINIGDTYNSGGNYRVDNLEKDKDNKYLKKQTHRIECGRVKMNPQEQGIPSKCLTIIPFRFAIEMVNRGWILRNVIIWHKPNCMPSSVKDRFTVDFEYIFFFSKKKKYYFETQFEDTKAKVIEPRMMEEKREVYSAKYRDGQGVKRTMGRNVRAVWSINPQPFGDYYCTNCGHFSKPKSIKEEEGYFGGENKQKRVCEACGKELISSHFAIYPKELCETPINAGCPEFVCVKCGKARERIIEYKGGTIGKSWHNHKHDKERGMLQDHLAIDLKENEFGEKYQRINKGLTNCDCNAGFTSGIVLDPFFGAGTTGLVALKQNKKFIGIELNKEYIEIAKKRLKPFLEQTKLT